MSINFNKLTQVGSQGGVMDPSKEYETMLEHIEIAREGLKNIRTAREKKKTIMEEHERAKKSYNNTGDLYEPFDELAFEGKTRIDMIYYDQFFQKIEEDEDKLSEIVGSLYKTVRDIYEFVNIKPETYGRNINYEFLNESVEKQQKVISNIIYEYINNHFYKMTPEKRQEKYLEESRDLAKEMIKDGNDPDESIKFAIKQTVMEGLLERIAFPRPVWYRVKFLTEDESYGQVFDQEGLIKHVELFESKLFELSKIIAITI